MKKIAKGALISWIFALMFFITSFQFIPKGQIVEFFTGILIAAALGYLGYSKQSFSTK